MTSQHQRVHHVVVKHVPKKIPRKQRPSVQSAARVTTVATAKSVHRVAKSQQHQMNQSYI
jgi:glycerol-3-phosphate cytidylyltransferase-like family protein